MKKHTLLACGLALALGARARGASLDLGPVINPANGHTYYLLTPDTWTNSEAFAVTLGGHLATINDGNENDFVFNAFGTGRDLWIGLTDQQIEHTFTWISGEVSAYTNWRPLQPDDFHWSTPFIDGEDYVHIYGSQTGALAKLWNDSANDPSVYSTLPFHAEVDLIQGVVELPFAVPLPSSLAGGLVLGVGMAAKKGLRRLRGR
jgi:hypothetical protein